jgi:hypothetical protein
LKQSALFFRYKALVELASFLDYLRHKSTQCREVNGHSANFLVSVAGLGNSGQQDVSERDEEILRNEIDPAKQFAMTAILDTNFLFALTLPLSLSGICGF